MPDPGPAPLDLATVDDVVDRLLAGQERAVAAARAVAGSIAAGVDLVAGRFAAGGRVFLAAADPVAERVLEIVTADLTTEFGLADGAVLRVADTHAAPNARDAVLVVSTGGGAGGFLASVRDRGAGTVVVTTGTPDAADVVVALATAPEPVDGLTRLGAATALKAALDALTTAVVAQLGRVHGDLPVDLVAVTEADRERVVAMVERITGVGRADAEQAAGAAGHDVRIAVLTLTTGLDLGGASTLAANRRTLRDALANPPRRPPTDGSAAR